MVPEWKSSYCTDFSVRDFKCVKLQWTETENTSKTHTHTHTRVRCATVVMSPRLCLRHRRVFVPERACVHACEIVRVTQEASPHLSCSLSPADITHFLLSPLVHSLSVRHSIQNQVQGKNLVARCFHLSTWRHKRTISRCDISMWVRDCPPCPRFRPLMFSCYAGFNFPLCTGVWTHGLSACLPVYLSVSVCVVLWLVVHIHMILAANFFDSKQKLKGCRSCFLF